MALRGYTVMVHRDGALESRQVRLSGWLARTLLVTGSIFVIGLLLSLVLYGPIIAAAVRTPFLEREIARLRAENSKVNELAHRLDDVEARYARLRNMLGGSVGLPVTASRDEASGDAEQLYVAPPFLARAPLRSDSAVPVTSADTSAVVLSVPGRWPLSVRSFRTRGLAVGDPGAERHSGLDLAVPIGSDVRATGGARVKEIGTDSAYGQFVLLEHAQGYESMYGHLSRVIVAPGDSVRAGQVIGLSGNSGRSTAPHLHFEIRRGGQSIDPLTLVRGDLTMGILGAKKTSEPAPVMGGLSIVAVGVTVRGDIESNGTVKVEGAVEGQVEARNQVLVAKGGVVQGDIEAREAVVGGAVHGAIRATERVEIQAGAVVNGDIMTRRIAVAEGGSLNGQIRMAEAPTPEAKASDRQGAKQETRAPAPAPVAPPIPGSARSSVPVARVAVPPRLPSTGY